MRKVTMTCLSPMYAGTSWTLELSDESIAVVNHEDEAEIVFSVDEAFRRIRFTESANRDDKVLILGDDGQEYDFELEPARVPFVKAFVEACVAQDPERAIRHFQAQAARCFWIALICVPVGLVAGVLTFALAPDLWLLYFGSVLFFVSGTAYLRWGLQDQARARRIARTVKCLPSATVNEGGSWSPWLIVFLAAGLAGNLAALAAVLLRYLSHD